MTTIPLYGTGETKEGDGGYQNSGEKLELPMVGSTEAGDMEEIQLLLEMCPRKEEIGNGKIPRKIPTL